jgi:hypothetical protein
LRECWCIPPKQNGEFVAKMEDVLELYHQCYRADEPLVCMDEQPVQLIKETRVPIGARPGKKRRYDYEYERNGTASIFLFVEPLAGQREVHVRAQRTMKDWAEEIRWLLDERYPKARKVRLVCDNLNTHHTGSLYEAFSPAEARRLTERLEIHYTPKHGSWLNIAEIELSAMTRQCLRERIEDQQTMRHKVGSWATERNRKQVVVDWQFTTHDARIKLKSLYPQFQ